MLKFVSWRLLLLILVLLLAAFLAAGQAVTFAWLSSFPERASQLPSLERKFWAYSASAAALLMVDIWLSVRLVRDARRRRSASTRPV